MGDWFHCNKCALKYNKEVTFFLTECGHVFCQRCVEKIKLTKRCTTCNKNGNVLPLNKDTEQSLADYFMPLENLLKKTIEVYKFQLKQRNQLYQMLAYKYECAKREYRHCMNTNRQLKKDNQRLSSLLNSSGRRNPGFTTSTPMSATSDSNVTFPNTSLMSSIAPQLAPPSGARKIFPGFPKRTGNIFSSGSSKDPSPAQKVPLGFLKPPPMVHRGSVGSNSTPKW